MIDKTRFVAVPEKDGGGGHDIASKQETAGSRQ
jgi:hypothetical protein